MSDYQIRSGITTKAAIGVIERAEEFVRAAIRYFDSLGREQSNGRQDGFGPLGPFSCISWLQSAVFGCAQRGAVRKSSGTCVAAFEKLLASGFLKPEERMVIYNTGSGLKYMEAYSTRVARHAGWEADKLGGLITPR